MGYNLGEGNTHQPQNIRCLSITGGVAGDHTVNGVGTRDILTSVCAGTEGDITTEFSITAANTINNTGGSDTSGETVVVMWYAQP
jgi:hypothetical protein